MEKSIKEQLIKSVSSIRSKLKQMQDNEDKIDYTMNKMLKPVAEPMKAYLKTEHLRHKNMEKKHLENDSSMMFNQSDNSSNISKYEDVDNSSVSFSDDDMNETVKQSNNDLDKVLERSLNKEDIGEIYDDINIPFGVRKEKNDFFMGNAKVNLKVFDNSLYNTSTQVITICNKDYELTPGLMELLLRKIPNLSKVTKNDQKMYKHILCDTNAHKRNYHPSGQIKGDRSLKYREIIRPLFLETLSNDNELPMSKSRLDENIYGTGLPTLKKYKPNTDFVFWDDPNELIDRLKILIASRDAGNSIHDNEIISIIEELKEVGIIKE